MIKSNLRVMMMTAALLMSLAVEGVFAQTYNYRRSNAGGMLSSYRATHRNRQDYYHFGYASVSVGYTALQEGLTGMVPNGGFGNQVGVGYEFRYHNFWMSVGGQLNWHRSSMMLDEFEFIQKNIKTPNATHTTTPIPGWNDMYADWRFKVNQNDVMNVMLVDVPLLFGGYYQGFYFGAGPKVSFGLNTKIQSKGTYTAEWLGDRYIDWSPYPNPKSDDGKWSYETEQSIRFKPHFSICGEIGFDVLSMMETRSPICHVLKVGFYFEVAVNSMVRPVPEDSRSLISVNGKTGDDMAGYKVTEAVFNPYFTSCADEKTRVAPFYTGLKITYMIGGNKNSNHGVVHRGCQCYE